MERACASGLYIFLRCPPHNNPYNRSYFSQDPAFAVSLTTGRRIKSSVGTSSRTPVVSSQWGWEEEKYTNSRRKDSTHLTTHIWYKTLHFLPPIHYKSTADIQEWCSAAFFYRNFPAMSSIPVWKAFSSHSAAQTLTYSSRIFHFPLPSRHV